MVSSCFSVHNLDRNPYFQFTCVPDTEDNSKHLIFEVQRLTSSRAYEVEQFTSVRSMISRSR